MHRMHFHPAGKAFVARLVHHLSDCLMVDRLPVLAQFRFADYPLDLDVERHDIGQIRLDKFRRRISHAPTFAAIDPRLHAFRQAADDGAFCPAVMLKADPAMDMNNLIVPGWHVPVMHLFCRIPIRRDIAALAPENRHHRRTILKLAMQIIRQRDMPDQPVLAQQQ